MEDEKKDLQFVNEQIVKPSRAKRAKRIGKGILSAAGGIFVLFGILFVILFSLGRVNLTEQETPEPTYLTLVPKTTAQQETTTRGKADPAGKELNAGQLKELAQTVNRCLVTVRCYEKKPTGVDSKPLQITSGAIVKESNTILILTDYGSVKKAGYIDVVFSNLKTAAARVKKGDTVTDTAILTIPEAQLDDGTRVTIDEAKISGLQGVQDGDQIIYIGNPISESRYIDYGMITGSEIIPVMDGQRHVFYTNIALAGERNGFFIDRSGKLVGIANRQADTEQQKIISFLGITDLTDAVERLSNGIAPPYMGIYGLQMTDAIRESIEEDIEHGVYVMDVETESPAYVAGVRNGDIIVAMIGQDIYTPRDIMTALQKLDEGDTMTLTVQRPESDGYKEYEISVILEGKP